jgi:hypothetical protein
MRHTVFASYQWVEGDYWTLAFLVFLLAFAAFGYYVAWRVTLGIRQRITRVEEEERIRVWREQGLVPPRPRRRGGRP